MYMKRLLLLLSLFVVINDTDARTRKVLFIGNSYIYSNNIPMILQQIAASYGDTLIYEESVPGGYTLEAHTTNTNTLNKIKSTNWDIVILQEQSQRPAFPDAQVASDTYPYARILDSLIKDNNSCTETMFYMTWGRKNGDAQNCQFYPPLCTYDGMQQKLRERYLQMAQNNSASVAPVGAAWKAVRDSVPSIGLYVSDESHPSVAGSYLAACVFYASIFHRSPYGTSFTSSLSNQDAERLQYFSSKVTMDSLNQWQQHGNYTYADFTSQISGNTATFTNSSLKASTYNWNFGDANTSMQTSPSHTYSTQGQYIISLTAENTCHTETSTDTLNLGNVDINNIVKTNPDVDIINTTGGIRITPKGEYDHISVYNSAGILIKEIIRENSLPLKAPSGIYMIKVSGKDYNSNTIYKAVIP